MVTRFKAGFTQTIAPHPKTRPEFEHRVRSLSLTDALIAVEWLNAAAGSAPHRRVLKIRRELEELGATLDGLLRENQEVRTRGKGRLGPIPQEELIGSLDHAKRHAEFRERHNALNKALSRYSFSPVMVYGLPSGVWRYNAVPKKTGGPEIVVAHEGTEVRINAAAVVAAFARLAANRELHKVRLCEQCRKRWRVSERQIDRFCSQECRQTWYRAQPDFKGRRRKIQKNHRENQKRKDARALASAQAQRRKKTI